MFPFLQEAGLAGNLHRNILQTIFLWAPQNKAHLGACLISVGKFTSDPQLVNGETGGRQCCSVALLHAVQHNEQKL